MHGKIGKLLNVNPPDLTHSYKVDYRFSHDMLYGIQLLKKPPTWILYYRYMSKLF